ncbi:MAG: SDR family oxidoreductase [Kiritimatiellia bacterium]
MNDKEKDMFSMKGRTALITGSARGIGHGIALAFAEFGATVVLHDICMDNALEKALADVRAFSPDSVAVTGDLAVQGMGRKIVEDAVAMTAYPDVVIANASVQMRKSWLDVTPEDALLQMQVNFHATLQMFQAAYPGMKEKGWGRMVTIGSVQERKPHMEMPVYAASKSALENLVRNLSRVVAPEGITVNNISPGVFHTSRNQKALGDPEYAEKVRSWIPIRDFAEPRDAAGTALLICSQAGRYINGATFAVDGGMAVM